MPILSELSRRFHMLTVDAKPDPPRSRINEPPVEQDQNDAKRTSNSNANKNQQCQNKSKTSQENVCATPLDRVRKTSVLTKGDSANQSNSTKGSEEKKTNYKTHEKSKRAKASSKINVVKYNVINSHKVNIGAKTSYICNVNSFSNNSQFPQNGWSAKPEEQVMSEDIKSLTTCTDIITFKDMFLVKTHIGRGWIDVARKLDYSNGQIDQFEENNRHKGIGEVVYQLLLDWKQNKTSEAQVGILVRAMWACREYDCVQRWVAARNQDT